MVLYHISTYFRLLVTMIYLQLHLVLVVVLNHVLLLQQNVWNHRLRKKKFNLSENRYLLNMKMILKKQKQKEFSPFFLCLVF